MNEFVPRVLGLVQSASLVLLMIAGCAQSTTRPTEVPTPAALAPWAEAIGAVLFEVQACVRQHPRGDAVVVGVRLFRTREIGVLTRGPDLTLVGCVHDGRAVVHRRAVVMPPREAAALPFLTLGETEPRAARPCVETRPLRWGSRIVGWLGRDSCGADAVSHKKSPNHATDARLDRQE